MKISFGMVAVQVRKSREELGIRLQKMHGKDEKEKGCTGSGGTCWFDGVSP